MVNRSPRKPLARPRIVTTTSRHDAEHEPGIGAPGIGMAREQRGAEEGRRDGQDGLLHDADDGRDRDVDPADEPRRSQTPRSDREREERPRRQRDPTRDVDDGIRQVRRPRLLPGRPVDGVAGGLGRSAPCQSSMAAGRPAKKATMSRR